jgi:hypothetical protein
LWGGDCPNFYPFGGKPPKAREPSLKLDSLIKPYYCNLRKLQVFRRLLSNSTLLVFLPLAEPKLLQGLLRPRAPPWYFLPKIQSCQPPRICPPITNPLTVKLPLSIQWTPATQCCLPSSINSLMAPSPPCDKQRNMEKGRV